MFIILFIWRSRYFEYTIGLLLYFELCMITTLLGFGFETTIDIMHTLVQVGQHILPTIQEDFQGIL